MDLIPQEFRQGRKAKRMLRAFAIAVVAVVLIVSAVWAILAQLIAAKEKEILRLREQDGTSQRQQGLAGELRQRKAKLEEQLLTLSRLRGGEKASTLLRSLDASLTEGVWLDSMHLQNPARFEDISPLKAMVVGVTKDSPKERNTSFDVELAGQALDHTRLAAFMRSLGSQHGVRRVDLVETKGQKWGESTSVGFTVLMYLESGGNQP